MFCYSESSEHEVSTESLDEQHAWFLKKKRGLIFSLEAFHTENDHLEKKAQS